MSFQSQGALNRRNFNLLVSDSGAVQAPAPGWFVPDTVITGGTPSGGFDQINNRNVFTETGSGSRTAVVNWPLNTGRLYFEVQATIGNGVLIGWVRNAAVPSDLAGAPNTTAAGYFWINAASNQFVNQELGTIALGASGAGIYMFALDLTASRHWIGKDGVWITGNPSTDTAPFWTNTLALGRISARVQAGFGLSAAQVRTLQSELTYPLPTGFSAYAG